MIRSGSDERNRAAPTPPPPRLDLGRWPGDDLHVPRLPTARQSCAAAVQFARALGANLIPCTVGDRRPLVKWAHLHSPGSPRLTDETLAGWAVEAERRERDEGQPTAWQILPGSARLAALDCDRPEALAGILERYGETPLVMRSPTPGRAHLWFSWPAGTDVGSVAETALGGAYAVKARGAAIHAPHSIHKSGSGWYTCSIPPGEWVPGLVGRLPPLDLAALDDDRVGRLDLGLLSGLPEEWAGEDEAERRGIAWLRAAGPPLPGEREQKTWRAAMTLGDLGVREVQAMRLIVAWDGESLAPRGPVEAADTVARAFERRRLPGGCRRTATGEPVDADGILADLQNFNGGPEL